MSLSFGSVAEQVDLSSASHCPAPADPSGVSTVRGLMNAAANTWPGCLASLHAMAEQALRNVGNRARGLLQRPVVPSQSTGPRAGAEGEQGPAAVL